MGVLPSIARGLSVGEAAAGQVVTVFSVICAVFAPLAAAVTASWPRGRLLTGGVVLFCVANLAVPFATSYAALMTLRVLAALAAAVVLPAVFAVTAALAPPGRQGRDLATVTMGLTAAVVAGVPPGTWLGAAFGWRAVFVAGGVLGVVALLLLRACLPEPPVPPAISPAERLRPLTRPAVLLVLLAAVVAVAGNLMFQTYLAPFLEGARGVGPTGLGAVLVLTGVAGAAGGRLSGTPVDRSGPARAFSLAICVFAAAMGGLALAWSARPAPLALLVPLLVPWSAAAWSVPAARADARPAAGGARRRPPGSGAQQQRGLRGRDHGRRSRRLVDRHGRRRDAPGRGGRLRRGGAGPVRPGRTRRPAVGACRRTEGGQDARVT